MFHMLVAKAELYRNLINGQWKESSNEKTFVSHNPAKKDEVVGIFQASTKEDVKRAIESADEAFHSWANTSPSKRAAILNKAAQYLIDHVDQFAEELTREEGKPVGASRGEVLRSAQTLKYYAVEGQSHSGETFPQDDQEMDVSSRLEPLGVITVITPWNFPLSIPARKIAPALITGNTVVFKPSSETPLVAYRLVEALVHGGLPDGVLNFITGHSKEIGDSLVDHQAVKAVTFTGSTGAGERIHRNVSFDTRTQMELGGKNPLIVMEDADIELAATLTVNGGYNLTGQACTGTSRVIVMKEVKEKFVKALIEKTKTLKMGSGFEEGVTICPLASVKQLKNVLDYIRLGLEEGANLVYGGEHVTEGDFSQGYYVRPAIFSDVTPLMRIAQEEIFGPVISVIEAENYKEALNIANGVEYGLSASIVTNDLKTAHRFTKDIKAGTVKVNRTTTGNLMNAPFGGIKKSSTSTFRESGRAGLDFFTQIKTVYIGY
jgi:alpha-ketoglutaric semialdehyde dehydrogenase